MEGISVGLSSIERTFHQSPQLPDINKRGRRVDDRVLTQDYVWIWVSFVLLIFAGLASIGLTFIRFDRLVLEDDRTFDGMVEAIKTELRLHDNYPDEGQALNAINRITTRQSFRALLDFYMGDDVAEIIIQSDELYDVYLREIVMMPNQTHRKINGMWGASRYTTGHNLVVAVFLVMALLVLATGSFLEKIGERFYKMPSKQPILTRFGMRVFWAGVLLLCVVEIVLLGLIYQYAIPQFIVDMLGVTGLRVKAFHVGDIVGREYFLLVGVWVVLAGIALGSIRFRPQIGGNAQS